MINQDLNAKIDQMVETPTADMPTPEFDQPTQPLPDTEDSIFTGEEIQTAGLGGALKGILKGGAKEAVKRKPQPRVLKPKAKTATEQVKEMATAAETSGLGTKEEALKAGKLQQKINQEPTVTPEQLQQSIDQNIQKIEASAPEELKPPKQAFNLPLISDSVDLQAAVKSVAETAGIKTQNITFDDVVASAKAAGMDEKFISELTEGKLSVNPENTYLALEAQKASADHLTELMRKINDSPADVTPADELEAAQTIAFHSLLQRQIKNYQTNVAQSLAVMRIPRQGFVDLSEATGGLTNSSDLRRFAKMYMTEGLSAADKAKMIDSAATATFGQKLISVWINGILSRPSTHLKNAVSNFLQIPIRMTERAGAASINNLRRVLGVENEEQYYLTEIYSMLAGFNQAVKDGASMARFAFKEGYSATMDDANKIALTKARSEIFDYTADNQFANIFKSLNFIATLPGRSLLTADEFFKGMNYRFELEALATRNGIKAFDDATAAGQDGAKAFDDAVNSVYANPPEELLTLSQEATFTKPMEGIVKKAQDIVNSPTPIGYALKVNLPFISTPINLNLQVLERTPLALLSKRIRADIAAGGKAGDLATAKIGIGSAFGLTMANYAADGRLTGAGPADKGQVEALKRQGWQPFSIVLDFDNITEEQRQTLSSLPTNVQYGSGDYAGKVFVSYQGMEPIGAFLAMASNYADYVKYEDDNSKINTQAAALAYGFYDYMMDSPFLQGLSNIMSTFDGRYGSDQDKTIALFDKLQSSFVRFAGQAVTPLSGFVTSGREKIDPYQREYKVDPNYQGVLPAGVVQGINDVINRTPGLSERLPLKLNLWGEPVQYEYTWSPIRMKKGKMSEADQIIIQSGTKVGMPDKNITKSVEKGLSVSVPLSQEEYNEMLRIANEPPFSLQDRIVELGADISELPLYKQQSIIKSVIEETFSGARDVLYSQSPEIQQRIQDRADIIREKGLGAK